MRYFSLLTVALLFCLACDRTPSYTVEKDIKDESDIKDEETKEEEAQSDVAPDMTADDGVTADESPDLPEPDDDVADDLPVEEIPDEDTVPGDPCAVDPQPIDNAEPLAFDPETVPYSDSLFPDTVQAGSMESDRVILWGYTEDNETKQLRVWRESTLSGEILLVFDEEIVPTDGYMKRTIEGLAPGTWYRYAFFTMSGGVEIDRSLVGRFRTAIHDDCMEPITISGTHGTNAKNKYTALTVMAQYDADFFVQLGDFSYNDGCNSTDDFRAKWHATLATTEYKVLLPTTGQYLVWDDHEVEDNGELEPDRTKDPEKVKRGYDAWFETIPSPQFPDTDDYWHVDSYWRSYRWGRTLEVFALDCRAERQHDTKDSNDPIYIGKKQMAWFKQALLDSTAHFKVILNSVPIVNYWALWDVAAGDRWEGYTEQRDEILQFILANNIANVVWLSGDFHTGSVARLEPPDHPYSAMWEINMGPGGNSNPLGSTLLGSPDGQFFYMTGSVNATLITFDPIEDSIHTLFIDPGNGKTLYESTIIAGQDPVLW